MQFKANDGSMHPSQKQAFDAGQKPPMDQGDGSGKSIQDDPKAMELVDQLKGMGYTADDVEQAMGGGDDQQGGAPVALPPMS